MSTKFATYSSSTQPPTIMSAKVAGFLYNRGGDHDNQCYLHKLQE